MKNDSERNGIDIECCNELRVSMNLKAAKATVPRGSDLGAKVALLVRHYDGLMAENVAMAQCDRCNGAGPAELDMCPFCGEPNGDLEPGRDPEVDLKVGDPDSEVDLRVDDALESAPASGDPESAEDASEDALESPPEGVDMPGMPPVHAAARVFPHIVGADFAALVESMKSGFDANHAIVTLDGAIVDGVNRYRAALVAGVVPIVRELTEGLNPWEVSRRENGLRRHLEPLQRAALYLKIDAGSREWATSMTPRGAATDSPESGDSATPKGRARDRLAKEADVSPKTAQRALDLQRKDPERFDRVAAGERPGRPAPNAAPEPEREPEIGLTAYHRAERLSGDTVRAAAPLALKLCEILKPIARPLPIALRRTAHSARRGADELIKLHDVLARVLAFDCPTRPATITVKKLRANLGQKKSTKAPAKKKTPPTKKRGK